VSEHCVEFWWMIHGIYGQKDAAFTGVFGLADGGCIGGFRCIYLASNGSGYRTSL
jgi:hypothetical protein